MKKVTFGKEIMMFEKMFMCFENFVFSDFSSGGKDFRIFHLGGMLFDFCSKGRSLRFQFEEIQR